MCSFGVPATGPTIAVSTSPSAAVGATYTSFPPQVAHPAGPAHMPPAPGSAAAPATMAGPVPGVPAVPMPVTGMPMPMPVTAGAQQGNLPEGAQMLLMQVPAGHQAVPSLFQVPLQQGAPPGAQMVFMAPAAPAASAAPAPVVTQVAPVAPAPAETRRSAPAPAAPAEPGLVSDTNALQHDAGRQLFNEALDPATWDGANTNLPSKGSWLHGTGRCSPCAWFWKARGCNSSFDCTYCHLCPEGELKNRKKAKVQAIRMGVLEPAGKAGASTQIHNRGALKLNQLI